MGEVASQVCGSFLSWSISRGKQALNRFSVLPLCERARCRPHIF